MVNDSDSDSSSGISDEGSEFSQSQSDSHSSYLPPSHALAATDSDTSGSDAEDDASDPTSALPLKVIHRRYIKIIKSDRTKKRVEPEPSRYLVVQASRLASTSSTPSAGPSAPKRSAGTSEDTDPISEIPREYLDDRWPLQIRKTAQLSARYPLPETIRKFALSTISKERLKHRKMPARRNFHHGRKRPLDDGGNPEDDVLREEPLPLDIVESTAHLIDTVLIGLAAFRPALGAKDRSRLRPMGWEDVMDAAVSRDIDEE